MKNLSILKLGKVYQEFNSLISFTKSIWVFAMSLFPRGRRLWLQNPHLLCEL